MRPFVVLPVKSLAEGKSRLAEALEDSERRRLNEWLLARSIATARMLTSQERVVVVSDCASALTMAAAHAARAFRTKATGALNPALDEARAALLSEHAEPMLVLAVDLPLVRAGDLLEVLVQGAACSRVVVCPDRHGTGTNALYLPAMTPLSFRFGPGSCAAHAGEARNAGRQPIVWLSPRIAFDLDTPADLDEWYRMAKRSA